MYEYKKEDVYDLATFIGAETKVKGDELFFKWCPRCQGGKHDRETFSVNLNTGAFNCFRASCGYQGHFVELARDVDYKLEDDMARQFKPLPQKKIEVKPFAVTYMAQRGISEETVRRYCITTQNKNHNVLVFPFYDEQNVLRFVKYRNAKYNGTGNKEWCEKDTKPILFGMAQCEDFERLVITEGQIDSLSVAECGIKNAVSVPTGAKGFTWLTHCWDWISKFKEVVVFGDCEKGAISLIDTLEKRLRTVVKCVRTEDYLCEKDANDILVKYGKGAIVKAIDNAEIRDVRYVKRLATVTSKNISDIERIETGIRSLDRCCGGVLMGHVILLSGKRGEGKSTFMSQIVAEAIDQGNGVFIYSGELPNYHFKNWLDLQIAGGQHIETKTNKYGDNEYYLTEDTVEKINAWYYDKAFIFDNEAIPEDDYAGLLETVADAICRYGVKLICIDNLMTALECDVKTDLYRQQSKFVKELEKMAQRYDVGIILVAHPKKSNAEFDNDTVSGSSDITNAVSFVWNYERGKQGNENNGRIMVTKNRMNGALMCGDRFINVFYSGKSKRIAENPNEKKEYSCFASEEFEFVEPMDYGDLPF